MSMMKKSLIFKDDTTQTTRSSNKEIIQKEEKEKVKQDRSSHFRLKIQLY